MAYSFLIISSSSSTFSRPFPLFLLPILTIFPLLIQIASGDTDLRYNCSSTSGNYTENSTYKTNLQNLLADLNNNTHSSGFRNTSYGTPGQADRVYGLALCRGDVWSSLDCQLCVKAATSYITDVCPNKRAAIYWRELCYVKYSNDNFLGDIDIDNKFTMVNPNNVSYSVTKSLTAVVLGLLSNLSKNATETAGIHMFACGKAREPQEGVDVRGMVQCSGDLSKDNCTRCLEYAMDELPKYNNTADGQMELFTLGARTVTGSCNIRYEDYDFLNN